MSDLNADPAAIFRAEAVELFQQLESGLLDLEADPQNRELIDGIFRALHTIKGSGAMFGFEAASAFTHHIENAFDLVRRGELAVSRSLVELGLAATDHIKALVDHPESVRSESGAALLTRLAAITGDDPLQLVAAKPEGHGAEKPSAPASRQSYRVHFRLPADALRNGTNPLLLLRDLAALGTFTPVLITDDVPTFAEIDPSHCYCRWECVLTTEQSRSAIDDVFIFVIDDMELSVERIEAEDRKLGEILIDQGVVAPDSISKLIGEKPRLGQLLIQEGEVSPGKVVGALAEQKHLRDEAARTTRKEDNGIRVQAERLDHLMDQVGELVIAQARLRQLANSGGDSHLTALVEEIERLSAELRDTTMGIRMVPIASLFGRFRRLVRDLSRELGKEVDLVTLGEETELDKTVIERLHDPIVHLIRNSLDHGLQGPEDRLAEGKPRVGTLTLSAVHSGTQVLIKIRDDGRGINRERVRAKAEESGLIAPAAEIADSDLLQLIFHPGFSTAAEVTSLSGRGVGMDVVKRTIEGLRGDIDIASETGAGTEITLRLPLTLAIVDGLLIRVGKGRYVIPLAAVEECVELSAEDDLRNTGRDFLNIRGEVVPFLRLKRLFGLTSPAEEFQKVVIVSGDAGRVGLVVDQIIGSHQTVIKSLSPIHAGIPTFSGATILGDGSVALILDVMRLVDASAASEFQKKAS